MNYVLSQLSPASGASGPAPPTLSEAVRSAARLGILEREPMKDVCGIEVAQKILVLGE
jgi:homoserine dehydrogenase